jgi:hypothetical protein
MIALTLKIFYHLSKYKAKQILQYIWLLHNLQNHTLQIMLLSTSTWVSSKLNRNYRNQSVARGKHTYPRERAVKDISWQIKYKAAMESARTGNELSQCRIS